MFCIYCGKEIHDQSQFCSSCGMKLPAANSSGQPNNSNAGPLPVQPNSGYTNNQSQTGNLFDSMQGKVQAKLGAVDNRQMTHPFQKLGGFLAVLTYGWLIVSIIYGIRIICTLVSMATIGAAGLTGEVSGPILIISVLVDGIGIFLCLKMFLMIQKKDAGFLRFYETMAIILLGAVVLMNIIFSAYLNSMLGGFGYFVMASFWGSAIVSMVISCACFILVLMYFGKSVRVRTYFGTDEYLRRSIFLKNRAYPIPAVPDRV